MKRLSIILIVIALHSNVYAQRPKEGVWLTVNMPVSIATKWQWHNDAGYRTLGATTQPLQYFYRTGARYIINKKWNAAAGIAFFFSKTDFNKSHHEFGTENRTWQEVNYQQRINDKANWQLRLRNEQRFFESTSVKATTTAYRIRLRTAYNQKINKQWAFQVADEYMHQATNKTWTLDQNRFMLSALYRINSTSQIQTGYMWLLFPKDVQHILTITLIKNISLHGAS